MLRSPERFKGRDELEQSYFLTDAARTAGFLGLPYAYPKPSPITFKLGSLWVSEDEQSRKEYLKHFFVGSAKAGFGLEFLDKVGRMLWDRSTPDWDQGDHQMRESGLDIGVIQTTNPGKTKTGSKSLRRWNFRSRALGRAFDGF